MSDNNGGGLLGLLVGIGLAGMVLAPFRLVRRYGPPVPAWALAVLATGMAVFSPELVAMARETPDTYMSLAMGAPAARFILVLDEFGWWLFAGLAWAGALLSGLAYAHLKAMRNPEPNEG